MENNTEFGIWLVKGFSKEKKKFGPVFEYNNVYSELYA
jgi:hypothetical protein